MELSKSTTQGLGALALIGVLGAAGFFVVKPQVEEAFSLQTQTQEVRDSTGLREIRLVKLQTESSNLDQLTTDVNDLLLRIPSEKSVTDMAGAVIAAMPPGVYLESFSHGNIDAKQPKFEVPEVSLTALEPPFELVTGTVAPTPTAADKDAEEGDDAAATAPATPTEEVTPALAGAPFILTVRASSYETLANFIDIMQFQKRLITTTAITSSIDDATGQVTATIYAYAYTGSTPKIVAWETAATTK